MNSTDRSMHSKEFAEIWFSLWVFNGRWNIEKKMVKIPIEIKPIIKLKRKHVNAMQHCSSLLNSGFILRDLKRKKSCKKNYDLQIKNINVLDIGGELKLREGIFFLLAM